jgi:pimeloyl-ACP methyl ester carboxylesterase
VLSLLTLRQEPVWCNTAAVTELTRPRLEGTVEVAPGRYLGFAEFGRPHGRPVIWMHGTPGARRQIPESARIAAEKFDICLIGLDRPGVGSSTPHAYGEVIDFAGDLEVVLDRLGIGEFAILGLSGGGPYTLAAAAAMPERVRVAGVMGGVAPTCGPDAVDGGIVALARQFQLPLTQLRAPISWMFTSLIWLARPVGQPALKLYARLSPPGDRVVFARPEVRAMFLDDLLMGSAKGLHAPMYDVLLFGRPWGFELCDVKVPVHWWHGDADHIVPLRHAQQAIAALPDAHLYLRPGESHLGTLIAAEDILGVLMRTWDESLPGRRPSAENASRRGQST